MDYLILSLIVIGIIIFLLIWLYIWHKKSNKPLKKEGQKITTPKIPEKNQNFEDTVKKIEEKLKEE